MYTAQLKKLALMGVTGVGLVMFQNCGQQVGFGDDFAQGRLMADSIVVVDQDAVLNESFENVGGESDSNSSTGGSTGSTGSNTSNGDSGQGPGQIAIAPQNGSDGGTGSQHDDDSSVRGDRPEIESPRVPAQMAGPHHSDHDHDEEDCEESKKGDKGHSGDKKHSDDMYSDKSDDHSDDDSSDDHSSDDSKALGICITSGPGKSHRIKDGGEEKTLTGVATPESLCMTKKACEETMAEVFEVKEFKKTGFCKNDKAHTVRISDAMALGIVDGLKNR